jgi:hypothetical protein
MTTKLKSVFWGFPQRLASDTRGFTLVLVTLMLSTLIGFTGLGVKTGFWYAIKRQNQSAADFAALSGAFELYAGQASGLTGAAIYPDVCALAKRDAARNNFTFISFTCPAASPGCTSPSSGQMCANNPPVLGSNKNNNSVEVILSQQQSTIIAGFFLPNVTIDTRAVATILTNDQACLLALGTTGTDISEQGNPSITMPGCAIAAASNSASAVALGGSSSLTASAVVTPGNCSGCGTVPVVHASVSDPYAAKLNHTFLTNGMPTSGTCSAVTVNGTPYFGKTGGCVTGGSSTIGDTLFGPMQISGGLTIKNNNVDLCPNGVCFVDVTTQGSGYTSTPTVVFFRRRRIGSDRHCDHQHRKSDRRNRFCGGVGIYQRTDGVVHRRRRFGCGRGRYPIVRNLLDNGR